MAGASAAGNGCRWWGEPARNEVSVMRTSRWSETGIGHLRREFLADLRGGGGHDVEIPRVRREEVAGTLDLDEYRDTSQAAGVRRRRVELRLLQEAVTRDIRRHILSQAVDRGGDRADVSVGRDGAEDAVAHDHRRVGRGSREEPPVPLGAPPPLPSPPPPPAESAHLPPRDPAAPYRLP